MIQPKEVDFNTLGRGGLRELFVRAFGDVMRNIDNPNTKAKAKREIVIKIGVLPNKERSSVELLFDVDTKLAKDTPTLESAAFLGISNGKPVIQEWGRGQMQGQLGINDFVETEVTEETSDNKLNKDGFK